MSASVNLPLLHKVQKFSSGTGSPGWSRNKGRKTVVVVVVACFPWSYCRLPGLPNREVLGMIRIDYSLPGALPVT